jgi:hypothetical protein
VVEASPKESEPGEVAFHFDLGNRYAKGKGVPQDWVEAVKWFRQAAEKGYAAAQNSLGFCYDHGWGVGHDQAEAVRWFRKAAEQGYALAQYNLGGCYHYGFGVEKSVSEAVNWCRRAAEKGYAAAQYRLGVCYYNGEGVGQDRQEGVRWFCKAAARGHAGAKQILKSIEDVVMPGCVPLSPPKSSASRCPPVWEELKEIDENALSDLISPLSPPSPSHAPRAKPLGRKKLTPAMKLVEKYAVLVARHVLGSEITVHWVNDTDRTFSARYRPRSGHAGALTFNVARLGGGWFERPPATTWEVESLLLHEFASNHPSGVQRDTLAEYGAKLSVLKLREPELFAMFR